LIGKLASNAWALTVKRSRLMELFIARMKSNIHFSGPFKVIFLFLTLFAVFMYLKIFNLRYYCTLNQPPYPMPLSTQALGLSTFKLQLSVGAVFILILLELGACCLFK